MDSVDVEYLGPGRIRLIVTEKNPIGYVELNGNRYYFDPDGVVLEAVSEDSSSEPGGNSLAGTTAQGGSPSPETGDVPAEESESRGTAVDAQPADTSSDTGEQEEETEGEGQTVPSLSDLTMVTGLGCRNAAVGEKLSVKDDSVFNTIQALDRMIQKYQIHPDAMEFSQDLTVTLHYGDVQVDLGADENLEEKMIRVAAILPELRGKSGVLHLEDYTEDTQNIVFSQEGEQESSS